METSLYYWMFFEGDSIIMLLDVDDVLIVGQDVKIIHKLKVDLYSKPFDIKDLWQIRHNRECGNFWFLLKILKFAIYKIGKYSSC